MSLAEILLQTSLLATLLSVLMHCVEGNSWKESIYQLSNQLQLQRQKKLIPLPRGAAKKIALRRLNYARFTHS